MQAGMEKAATFLESRRYLAMLGGNVVCIRVRDSD